MATFNASAFVAAALDSVLAQTYADFRVIISDDASSDGTLEICQGYAARDPRVSVYPQTRRLGWVGNVNRALRYARGSALMIMPHDDRLDPDYLAALVAALEDNPAAALAFTDLVVVTPGGERRLHVFDKCEGSSSPAERAVRIAQSEAPWWVCYRGVVRMAAFREAGGPATHWRGEFSADKPWLLRLAIAGELVRVPRVLYEKHDRETSVSRSWSFSRLDWLAVYLSCMRAVAQSRLSTAQALPVYKSILRQMNKTLTRRARRRTQSRCDRLKRRLREWLPGR